MCYKICDNIKRPSLFIIPDNFIFLVIYCTKPNNHLILIMNFELHPIIVHFPIALIILAYIFQWITVLKPEWVPKHLNLWVLVPAAISVLPASLTGEQAEESVEDICQEAHDVLENHELFANMTTWGTIILTLVWVWITLKGKADQKVQRLFLAFLTLIVISVSITGYLGGELVHVWDI